MRNPALHGPHGRRLRAEQTLRTSWYAVVPDGSALARRVSDTLAQLDLSGAHVGLVPESTLDNHVLEAWQLAMRTTRQRGALRLVLVGTGPVGGEPGAQPPNRAVMLYRHNGEPVFTQDKHHGYAMTFADLNGWHVRFDPYTLPGKICHEWMREGLGLPSLSTIPSGWRCSCARTCVGPTT